MPGIPLWLHEAVWVQFAVLLPVWGDFDPMHPLGCHRRRVPDRVVFFQIFKAADAQFGGRWPGRVTVHLDAGCDWAPTRGLLAGRGWRGRIARRGKPAPIQTGRRWVVEASHAWMNDFGELRRHTDRRVSIIGFYHDLAAAFVTFRYLVGCARTDDRWDGRTATRCL
ncbi:hypothetical protein AB0M46_03470 [Dactylosporangium sp. NPDC051485]|uniref:hypothetical protein n=1 Tax=Dactylosporangium sp. NPDC051485 TaxID=3154846 RepID=UPI00343052F5